MLPTTGGERNHPCYYKTGYGVNSKLHWTRTSKLMHGNSKWILMLFSVLAIYFLLDYFPIASNSYFCINSEETELVIEYHHNKFTKSDVNTTPVLITSDPGSPFIIEDYYIQTSGTYGHGIDIRNTISRCIIRNCIVEAIPGTSAIFLSNVKNCELRNVTVVSNGQIGIEFSKVHNATVTNCNMTENWHGMEITNISWNVTIANNTIRKNSQLGVYIDSSSRNITLYYNTFDQNGINARDELGDKSNNYTKNYWSDYDGPDDVDPFKIGDVPYEIAGNLDKDPLPLMLPADRPPIYWVTQPNPPPLELGSGLNYQLDVAIYGGLESWWTNDTSFEVDETGVLIEKRWLTVGDYGIEITVRNLYFDTTSATFTLTVEDTTKPEWIESPVNQFVEMGDGFQYDLNASDFSLPLLYSLVNSPNFAIDGASGVITNNTLLTPDTTYTINATVRDNEGLITFSLFNVTVRDSTPPVWGITPTDRAEEYGNSFLYTLSASDPSGLDTWAVNDTRFEIDAFGIITNATVLPVNDYPLLVSVNDTRGNTLNTTIVVTIEDTTRPIWVEVPTDQVLEAGHKMDLQLQAWDESGIAYWTISDTENFAITTLGRVFSIGELVQITYSLTVRAYDPYGNSLFGQFAVYVQDTQAPVWHVPLSDQTGELGFPLHIALSAYDPSGITGWTIEETSLFSIGTDGVITNVTILSIGEYPVHVSVNDPIGHILTGSFIIEIVDTTAPVITRYPTQINVTAPDTVSYLLQAIDLSGIDRWSVNDTVNFVVDQDGRLLSTGILPAGRYTIIVTAYDIYDNHHSVTITVNAFALDAGVFVIAGGVTGSVFILAILVILIFDPKRGRFSPWTEGGAKK